MRIFIESFFFSFGVISFAEMLYDMANLAIKNRRNKRRFKRLVREQQKLRQN